MLRGFDEEQELNLDDAIREVIDLDSIDETFEKWYAQFFGKAIADDVSEDEIPRVIAGKLTNELSFAIEIYTSETVFYLNDIYIGNLGGHFEAWFLTLDELLAFDRFKFLFLLLLPMVGIEDKDRLRMQSLISEQLKSISIFAPQADYIAQCIVNGLIVDAPFSHKKDVGIVSNTNHSVRNVEKYPRYINDVTELNKALAVFVAE